MESNEEYEEFIRRFTVTGMISGSSVIVEDVTKLIWVNHSIGKLQICPNVVSIRLKPAAEFYEPVHFYWPIGDSELKMLLLTDLDIQDMTKFPKSLKWLTINHVEIQSLKGIEGLPELRLLNVNDGIQTSSFSCGMLRLLKLGVKGRILIALNSATASGIREALLIVRQYMASGNIPECQQHLIEVGLQQFAKL